MILILILRIQCRIIRPPPPARHKVPFSLHSYIHVAALPSESLCLFASRWLLTLVRPLRSTIRKYDAADLTKYQPLLCQSSHRNPD